MMEHDIRISLDRSLDGMRFTPELCQAVLEQMAPPKNTRRLLRQGVAAALACGLLLTAALAAAPVLWVVIRDHLGSRASYASQPQVTVTDQGLELGVVTALADQNLVTVYLTLRDLEGDRLDQGAALELWAGGWEAEQGTAADSGGSLGYDPENGTWLFYRTFSRMEPREVLRLQVREIVPGYQDFYVDFSGAALAEAVPEETLKSAVGEDGNLYLLPGQNPVAMDWERYPLAEGAQPGIWISSMGYAEDGRLHFRFQVEEWASLLELDLPSFDGQELQRMAVLPDGVDYAFPPGCPDREDLEENLVLFFNGSYSTRGGPIQGNWDLEVPLELVETTELTWPGETVSAADGPETEIDGVWLSPLSFSVACRGLGGRSLLELEERPVVTLRDGTQVETLAGVRAADEWQNGTAVSVERLVWQLERPVDLEQVAHVAFCGVTIELD